MSRITREPIDASELSNQVGMQANGAVVIFVGQVRNHSRGQEVISLEYEGYDEMAEKVMERIADEASSRWPVQVAMQHRLGKMQVGEVTVAIAVGSAHRDDAFEACRFCIEAIKSEVPIWKKEFGLDGSYWIEGENRTPIRLQPESIEGNAETAAP